MNIVFAGTPKFAADHLEILLNSEHKVTCILTQPDKASGRGKKVKFSPVKEIAIREGIEVLQPNSLSGEKILKALENTKIDLMLVVAYGLLIPKKVLEVPKKGSVNIHASILPNWRGAAPIEYSICSGDKETGISYMRMTEGLDEGPILEVHKCKIEEKDNLGTLENKFIDLSKKKLLPFLKKFAKGEIKEVEQENSKATFAPKINTSYQQIDWSCNSNEIDRRIRSMNPKYGAFSFLGSKRIKIYKSSPTQSNLKLKPGVIEISETGELLVGCKNHTVLKIDEIQIEGKKVVSSKEFIQGYKALIQREIKFSGNAR